MYSVTRPQTQRRKPNHESWSLVLRQTLRTLIMYKHDGLLYYQAGHYGTEKACLRVTSLVTVTHVTSAEACYAEISSTFKSNCKCESCGAEPVCAVCDFAVSL